MNIGKFLRAESELRVSQDAISRFKELLEMKGKEMIAKLKEEVVRKNQKTITLETLSAVYN